MTKLLILGTAQWGWTVSPDQAFLLLDNWLKAGHRRVDCATNYPINKHPDDFRAAERILAEYVNAHGLQDLQVTMKIGSLDNMRSPDTNLAPSFIQMMAAEYHRILGKNLEVLMIHWDNRPDQAAVFASLESLHRIEQELHIRPGLSGIRFPEVYREANQTLGLQFDIQLKHNILQSDLERYVGLFDSTRHRLFAYGINAGGLKLGGLPYPADSTFLARGGQPEKATATLNRLHALLPEFNNRSGRPAIQNMNQLGLIYTGLNPHLRGILLGAGSVAQLAETLAFWEVLQLFDYEDVQQGLNRLSTA